MTQRIYFPFLNNFETYLIPSIADGNCFFHSLLLGFVIPYIQEKYENGSSLDRREFVSRFRKRIAQTLYDEENGKMLYERLADGNLKELSEQKGFGERYKLDKFYQWLCSSRSVGIEALEITSRYIRKNILILSKNKSDIYKIGKVEDTYNPNFSSIVLIYTQNNSREDGHFDLCGVKLNLNEKREMITHFSPKNEFIQEIIARSLELEN